MNPGSHLPGHLAPFQILAHRSAALWFSGGGSTLPRPHPLLAFQVLPVLGCPIHFLQPELGPSPTSSSWGVRNFLCRCEKSAICTASGTLCPVIQLTVLGARLPLTDIASPPTQNPGALWQPFLPNYPLIYCMTLWSSLCQALGMGTGVRRRPRHF